jgi:hypothetical protein
VVIHPAPPLEAVRRIHPLAAVVHHVHASSPLIVEGDRVHVDLAACSVDQHEAHRRRAGDLVVACVAKSRHESRNVVKRDDEIEIVVLPGLLLEERVDAPQPPSSQTAIPARSSASARRATSLASIGARGSRSRYGHSVMAGSSATVGA